MPNSAKLKYPVAEMKLEDVIVEKQGILHPRDSAQDAAEKMRSLGVDALPVSEDSRLVGVVDPENCALSASGRGHDPKTLTVGEAMNPKLVYCFAEDDSATALRRMSENRLDHLAVVDSQLRVVGMVHRQDLEPQKEE